MSWVLGNGSVRLDEKSGGMITIVAVEIDWSGGDRPTNLELCNAANMAKTYLIRATKANSVENVQSKVHCVRFRGLYGRT